MTLESRNKSSLTKPKITFAIISILLVLSAFLATTEATANMFGLFKKHDVHLSPTVSGKLSNGDTPLKGIVVTRSLTYDNEKIDTAVTDDQGHFSFPAISTTSRSPNSPLHEARIRQIISTEINESTYVLWYNTSFGIKEHTAINNLLSRLQCDINNKELSFEEPSIEFPNTTHYIHSICRWPK